MKDDFSYIIEKITYQTKGSEETREDYVLRILHIDGNIHVDLYFDDYMLARIQHQKECLIQMVKKRERMIIQQSLEE